MPSTNLILLFPALCRLGAFHFHPDEFLIRSKSLYIVFLYIVFSLYRFSLKPATKVEYADCGSHSAIMDSNFSCLIQSSTRDFTYETLNASLPVTASIKVSFSF